MKKSPKKPPRTHRKNHEAPKLRRQPDVKYEILVKILRESNLLQRDLISAVSEACDALTQLRVSQNILSEGQALTLVEVRGIYARQFAHGVLLKKIAGKLLPETFQIETMLKEAAEAEMPLIEAPDVKVEEPPKARGPCCGTGLHQCTDAKPCAYCPRHGYSFFHQ